MSQLSTVHLCTYCLFSVCFVCTVPGMLEQKWAMLCLRPYPASRKITCLLCGVSKIEMEQNILVFVGYSWLDRKGLIGFMFCDGSWSWSMLFFGINIRLQLYLRCFFSISKKENYNIYMLFEIGFMQKWKNLTLTSLNLRLLVIESAAWHRSS